MSGKTSRSRRSTQGPEDGSFRAARSASWLAAGTPQSSADCHRTSGTPPQATSFRATSDRLPAGQQARAPLQARPHIRVAACRHESMEPRSQPRKNPRPVQDAAAVQRSSLIAAAAMFSGSVVDRRVGWFTIAGVRESTPDGLWRRCRLSGAIGRHAYFDYFDGARRAFGIEIALEQSHIDFNPEETFPFEQTSSASLSRRSTLAPSCASLFRSFSQYASGVRKYATLAPCVCQLAQRRVTAASGHPEGWVLGGVRRQQLAPRR